MQLLVRICKKGDNAAISSARGQILGAGFTIIHEGEFDNFLLDANAHTPKTNVSLQNVFAFVATHP
jgi:hypothetical protein